MKVAYIGSIIRFRTNLPGVNATLCVICTTMQSKMLHLNFFNLVFFLPFLINLHLQILLVKT